MNCLLNQHLQEMGNQNDSTISDCIKFSTFPYILGSSKSLWQNIVACRGSGVSSKSHLTEPTHGWMPKAKTLGLGCSFTLTGSDSVREVVYIDNEMIMTCLVACMSMNSHFEKMTLVTYWWRSSRTIWYSQLEWRKNLGVITLQKTNGQLVWNGWIVTIYTNWFVFSPALAISHNGILVQKQVWSWIILMAWYCHDLL